MDVRDLFRYAFLGLVGLLILGFGLNLWGKKKAEKRIVTALQSQLSPTASFEQFYAEDAEKSLFQTMLQLHRAEERLGKPPTAMLDLAFQTPGTGNLFGTSDPTTDYDLDPRERLIRSSILRNYENCKRLGVFTDSISLDALSRGEAPQIQEGPAEGEWSRIAYIIDPKVSPGAEKIVPNMVISPPLEDKAAGPTEYDIALAKTLAESLQRAGILESDARNRIIDHYDNIGKEPEPEPARPGRTLEEILKDDK